MVYLNAGVEGGQTRFFADMAAAFADEPYLVVWPEERMALNFVHRIWHEGAIVRDGRKHALRTDVLYAHGPMV
jgi:prolyl 4-hydroxylase